MMKKRIVVSTLLLCLSSYSVPAAETVSIKSLLKEMVDRDAVARFPETDFRLKQHSSYDRRSKTPDDATGWFANNDYNRNKTHRNYIRIEENNGQKEWVLMDHKGAGAIVRTWMPFRTVPEDSLVRFYLDGATEPTLEGNTCTLLNGTGLIPYPFAHQSLFSAVSFFPIPYAGRCKVTVTRQPFFFQFTFREYPEGTAVESFTMKGYEAAGDLAERVGKTLLDPQDSDADEKVALVATLVSKEEKAVELPPGAAAVRGLSVKLGRYDNAAVTRSVVLKMEFDGKQTAWCPVGDFFGTGIGLHPFQGWYRTVVEDGTMSCRWVMPYRESGRISIVNLGDEPVDVQLEVRTGGWSWDDRSMVFHAAWRGQYPVATRPYSDWNYVTLKGRGVYVGDTLTVMNPVEKWWGEGDERIWVDGESFPSIFGTGTEDYYGYSWGGVSTDFYEHPFHAQPRCHKYNKLNRKTTSERNTQGYSTETRTRSLDTMPFGGSLQLDMEVWSWSDCDMGYGVGAYWYGDADTTSNRKPDPEGALAVPPLPDMRAPKAAPKPIPARVKMSSFRNAVECESMKVASKPGRVMAKPQELRRFPGKWSAASHLFVRGAEVGDGVELRVPAAGVTRAKLALHATRSYDYGILRFSINGQPAGENVDLFADKPIPSGPIELGGFAPVDNAYVLRAEVVGRNPKSKGTLFGLDCVVIHPAGGNDGSRARQRSPLPIVGNLARDSKPSAAPSVVSTSEMPNVVLIFADDLGYGDLGCYGATKVQTPNIDRLAAQGRRFTDAHSASAVCTPSRYALLTGDYPLRHGKGGVWGPLGHTAGLLIGTDRQTLGKVFQEAGYATAGIGKWHLGFGEGTCDWNRLLRPGPLEVGFDYYFGVPKVNSGFPYVYVENDRIVGWDPKDPLRIDRKSPSPTPTFPPEAGRKSPNIFAGAKKAHEIYHDERTASVLAEKAVAWIAGNKGKPFFLYLPTTNIHHPFTPAPRFKGTSQCGLYGDFIHELDWMVGEVVKCLEENGVADNTLVIFTSDNGGMFNVGGQAAWDAGHRLNGELLGFKFGAWEGGHRIPFIAKWPGKIEAGSVSRQLLCNVDMVATMAALTGIKLKDGHARDSVNLLPALTGEPEAQIRDHLVLAPHKSKCLSVRKGKWMYIGSQGSGGFTAAKRGAHAFGGPAAIAYAGYKNSDIENGKTKKDAPPAQLYDLETDIRQTKNLFRQHPEVVKELSALLGTYSPTEPVPVRKRKKRGESQSK